MIDMRFYLIFLPIIFILALVQSVWLSLNLVWLTLALLSLIVPVRKMIWLTFGVGLWLDLSQGASLGFSSLIFLIFVLILFVYRQRFDSRHPFFLAGFVFLTSLIYRRLVFQVWTWPQALVLAFLAFLLRPLVLHFQTFEGEIKLKL